MQEIKDVKKDQLVQLDSKIQEVNELLLTFNLSTTTVAGMMAQVKLREFQHWVVDLILNTSQSGTVGDMTECSAKS